MTIPLQFASVFDGQEVFVWSDCQLDFGTDFLVGNMIFVWDAQYLAVAPHFHGLYSSLELCCEGPWFTSIQDDECKNGAHHSYLRAERNALVNPNWFQPCQCCCCLCYPEEYLRLGTVISYNWAKVFEACNCLTLLFISFNLCVDATGVVCHRLGPLRTSPCHRLCIIHPKSMCCDLYKPFRSQYLTIITDFKRCQSFQNREKEKFKK